MPVNCTNMKAPFLSVPLNRTPELGVLIRYCVFMSVYLPTPLQLLFVTLHLSVSLHFLAFFPSCIHTLTHLSFYSSVHQFPLLFFFFFHVSFLSFKSSLPSLFLLSPMSCFCLVLYLSAILAISSLPHFLSLIPTSFHSFFLSPEPPSTPSIYLSIYLFSSLHLYPFHSFIPPSPYAVSSLPLPSNI